MPNYLCDKLIRHEDAGYKYWVYVKSHGYCLALFSSATHNGFNIDDEIKLKNSIDEIKNNILYEIHIDTDSGDKTVVGQIYEEIYNNIKDKFNSKFNIVLDDYCLTLFSKNKTQNICNIDNTIKLENTEKEIKNDALNTNKSNGYILKQIYHKIFNNIKKKFNVPQNNKI